MFTEKWAMENADTIANGLFAPNMNGWKVWFYFDGDGNTQYVYHTASTIPSPNDRPFLILPVMVDPFPEWIDGDREEIVSALAEEIYSDPKMIVGEG